MKSSQKSLSVLLYISSYIFVSAAVPVVHIQNGSLKGTTITSPRTNRIFYAFLGIPYAKPPIGELRFKSPQPVENWSGVKDATQEGSICLQRPPNDSSDIEGDEDCLFLNVVTPQIETDVPKPVMVWIHGGAFMFGSGSINEGGPHYLMDHDIVFVSINYRLGALGFLCMENEEVPGNAGMKDQVLALKWVQENIRQFGGDPNKVTIFGESAGGLFNGAISQSGSSLNPWAINDNCSVAFDLGATLGITTEDKTELVNSLRTFTGKEITKASQEHFNIGHGLSLLFRFTPTLDTKSPPGNVFLPDTAINILNSGLFNKVPYITGVNSAEGMVFLDGKLCFAIRAAVGLLLSKSLTIPHRNPMPEEDPLLQNLTWLPTHKNKPVYLDIDVNLSLECDMKNTNALFWKQLHRNYSLNPLC
ncbi:hypothetical protein C0J52_07808 [Blattella germanica]|nr:hypothetical protein C0J52_07808 [Blattella germanica]